MKAVTAERVVVAAGCLALATWFALFLGEPSLNHDVYHQMALARESLSLGHVPEQDLYSYAPTRNLVVDHEWLAGLVAWVVYSAAGLSGLGLLWLAISTTCFAMCARVLLRLPPLTAFAAGFLSLPAVSYSLLQPLIAQSWSVLLCGVILLLLRADAAGRHRLVFWSVPVFIVWTNLHGGVVIGLAIVGTYAIEQWIRGERYRHLAALFAILLATLAFNPYGWRYYPYLVRALTMPRPQIGEWQADWLFRTERLQYSIPFGLMAAVYAITVLRAGMRFRGALITALLAVASVRANKVIPFFGMAWLFYVPAALSATCSRMTERLWKKLMPFAGPAFTAIAVFIGMLLWRSSPWPVRIPDDPAMGLIQPVRAVDYLQRTGFRGNVMTFFRHGAYVAWRLYPRVKISCDARYEVAYPDGYAERNIAMYTRTPGMLREELRSLPATDLILTDRRFPLEKELNHLPGWGLAYSDSAFAIYAPRNSPNPVGGVPSTRSQAGADREDVVDQAISMPPGTSTSSSAPYAGFPRR